MAHKKEKHFKMKLCSYYHGLRTTCRFPAQHYLNIHNENIQPQETTNNDYRSHIICKHGNTCVFLGQPGGCLYKHAQNAEPQPNMWQQRPVIRQNTEAPAGAAAFVERSEGSGENPPNIPLLDMNQIVLNLSKQMETISQKLQFLELKSMQDFPSLGEGQRRS